MNTYTIVDEIDNIYELQIDEIIKLINNTNNQYYKIINGNKIPINKKMASLLFICHRINTIEELKQIPEIFGLELDLRDDLNNQNNKIKICHDPFDKKKEDFKEYLQNYKNKLMILNIKSERIESECLDLINQFKINNYFFLDSSFPMIYLMNSKFKNNNFALRFSEYEPINYESLNFYDWIWVDCFTKFPLTKEIYEKIKRAIKEHELKICIVSPELQGHPIEKLYEFRQFMIDNDIIPDAICCKIYNIYHWL